MGGLVARGDGQIELTVVFIVKYIRVVRGVGHIELSEEFWW